MTHIDAVDPHRAREWIVEALEQRAGIRVEEIGGASGGSDGAVAVGGDEVVAEDIDLPGDVLGEKVDEDKVFEIALDAGADDVTTEDSELVVVTPPEAFEPVKSAIQGAGLAYENAEITMIPQNSIKIEGREAENMIRLMEALEDSDDVQNVYSNFDVSEELMLSLAS